MRFEYGPELVELLSKRFDGDPFEMNISTLEGRC